jgi:hypothetical protein
MQNKFNGCPQQMLAMDFRLSNIWPRNERDIVVAKSASFGHGSLVFVVCGWQEKAVVGVFL